MEFTQVEMILLKVFLLVFGIAFISFLIGLLYLISVYIRDVAQTKQAIRRNYPVIGHLRYFFEELGKYFRQYFFAADRMELPFNRAERNWVDAASKDEDTTVAFGSTRYLHIPGTVYFANCPYPTLSKDSVDPQPVTLGPHCGNPYTTASIFNISGMSFGAISSPAVEALSKGAAMAGCWYNTGEGGLSTYHLSGNCDIIAQIGTAKYGYRDEHGNFSDAKLKEVADKPQVKMFELKLSQGAKPGKGGLLPAVKVTPEIAKIRGIPAYEESVSPNRHPEIKNNEELLVMINHIRKVTQKPVGIKFVVGDYESVKALCQTIAKHPIEYAPDFFTIDSADGGTGAAPQALIDYVGMPLSESLPIVIDLLREFKLKDRIKVVASGKLVTPAQVSWALCVGADFINSARGFMFALGCIQALVCNKNTCPTGITTHSKRLQEGLDPKYKSVRVAQYVKKMVTEVGVVAHACGVEEPRELRRRHCRIVTPEGSSVLLSDLYPEE